MNSNGRRAGPFCPLGQFDGRKGIVVPSGTHFHGDGNRHGLYDGGDDLLRLRQILHQGRAFAVFDDLFDGTAHVDIDNIRAGLFDGYCRLGHDDGIGPEYLHRQGMLPLVDIQQFFRMLVLIAYALRANHFRAYQSRAIAAGNDAVRQIAYAGHGGQDDRPFEPDRADGKGLSNFVHK